MLYDMTDRVDRPLSHSISFVKPWAYNVTYKTRKRKASLTGCLRTAISADTIKAPYLRQDKTRSFFFYLTQLGFTRR